MTQVPENYYSTVKFFFKKNQQQQLCKEWFAHAIARTARADENDNNTHFFSLLSVSKFQSFILNLRHKTHGKLNASSFCSMCTWPFALVDHVINFR